MGREKSRRQRLPLSLSPYPSLPALSLCLYEDDWGRVCVFTLLLFFCFVPLVSFGRKKKVVQQDKEEDITDILTSEGEEGWLERVLERVKHRAKNVAPRISTFRNVLLTRPTSNQLYNQSANLRSHVPCIVIISEKNHHSNFVCCRSR